MSERTEKLAKIDQWENLRERLAAGWAIGAALILTLLVITDGGDDAWDSLPLALVFAIAGGLALCLGLVFLGLSLRWQTLPRRVTLPVCWLLLAVGLAAAAYCLFVTDRAPRTPIGTAELRHAPCYFAGLAAAVFGAVNWPGRPKA